MAAARERIVAAAIQYDGTTISLPRPARHDHVLWSAPLSDEERTHACQGFLTSDGRFVNRIQALHIAYRAKQVKTTIAPPELFSEDVW